MAVEAASVIFGCSTTKEGPAFLERWLKKVCLDFRLRVVDKRHTVEFLLFKPSTRHWLTNCVQVYAKRWGFERTQWDHSNIRVMTREAYLAAPTPHLTGMVGNLLGIVYKNAAARAVGIQEWNELTKAKEMTEEEKQAREVARNKRFLRGQEEKERKRARSHVQTSC